MNLAERMKLCATPKCYFNCDIFQDAAGIWRYSENFQSAVRKEHLRCFSPSTELTLCPTCTEARAVETLFYYI